TVSEALDLHQRVNRPNVMIKVPGTKAGVSAFEELTAAGVNVNVTLLFSVNRYLEIVQAYLNGLEKRLAGDKPIKGQTSVASFFISRVDSAVDKALEEQNNTSLQGKIAIANARIAYGHFENIFHSDKFKRFAELGAFPQRLLWASTGTKNPSYSDVLYIEQLIGPETVNTVPPATLDAFRDHGVVAQTLKADLPEAHQMLEQLTATGIDLRAITDKLEKDGVEAFCVAFDELLDSLKTKRESLT
ncbi:MAG: transaldolase, partial [Gammaproteobacteria bacterium]|nr:transaldolase [Gammaproteobacteria bacterium]